MKTYLVGGCVRDKLLGKEPKDLDYVVVGATPEDMLSQGFQQVGADFPVFLHPDTRAEYALARVERKVGTGYHGFTVNADPTVSLEDDLRRRDLTMNAMAQDLETGEIVDPFGGRKDLERGLLRHVSEAFAEDPLRVLRVARFAARYGYKVAFDTIVLMQSLRNELSTLTEERVWLELEKALMEKSPSHFYHTLVECACWTKLFPEVNPTGIPLLQKAADQKMSLVERFAAMLRETQLTKADILLERLKAPANVVRVVHMVWKFRIASQTYAMTDDKAHILFELLKSTDAYRRTFDFLEAANVWSLTPDNTAFIKDVLKALDLAVQVSFADLPAEVKAAGGAAIGRAMDQERLRRLSATFDYGSV